MALIQQAYLARFALGTDRNQFSIGASAITLTAGEYYLFGYPAETAVQFCEHMQAAIRAGSAYTSATVTWDYLTGLITIATGGAAAALVWTDATLGTMLGFVGNQSSATSHVATNKARYTWLPSRALSVYSGVLAKWWDDRYSTIGYRSPTGTTYTLKGNQVHEGFYQYRNLLAAEVVTDPATTVWETFQRFYEDTHGEGQPIRVYPDRTDARPDGGAVLDVDLFTACFASTEEPAKFTDIARRGKGPYHGYWDVDLDLHEWVVA